ncbi:MAG TPA: S9 family peptidase [Herpetosiphonaceae bacterium]|nr:S9 family peptidase [Herpetosiphonaceae bacterium]
MTEQRRWTPTSLMEMRFISDAQISPDGKRIAFVESWIEEIEAHGCRRPGYRSAIYVIDADGGTPQRMTYSVTGRDAAPRWSPDGSKLAFLSTRDENTFQLFALDIARGGEARQLTELAYGVAEANWRPDSGALVFISRGDKNKEYKRVEKLRDEKIIERLPFKFDGVGYLQPEYAQLWLVELDGAPRQLSDAPFDHSDPAWAPDGREIAFVTVSRAELEHTRLADIYLFDVETGASRCLTNTLGPAYHPTWSPDGQRIAYIGHNQHTGNASNEALWCVSRTGGDARLLSDGFEYGLENSIVTDVRFGRYPYRPTWRDNGIYFMATRAARSRVYRYNNDGAIAELTPEETPSISSYTQSQNRRTALTAGTDVQPESLYLGDADGTIKPLYNPNAGLMEQMLTVKPERHLFAGAGDLEIEGWVMKPVDFQPGQKHPLLLYIHGGPHAAYGHNFMHEFQVLAAAGFGVWYVNPRGGTGYGQKFRSLVRQDFGGDDYVDLMRAADLAAGWDWVDPARMGVLGGSYGGYMTNWIISHTDRFAAANTQRCISNLSSFFGTSDIGPYFGEDEFGGKPWADLDRFIERSPIRHVDKINTPLLIIHADEDHRCPVEQAEQLYTALKVLERTVRFVRFPREGHELSRSGEPLHRIARMDYILDWFGHYLQGRPLRSADEIRRTVAGGWEAAK